MTEEALESGDSIIATARRPISPFIRKAIAPALGATQRASSPGHQRRPPEIRPHRHRHQRCRIHKHHRNEGRQYSRFPAHKSTPTSSGSCTSPKQCYRPFVSRSCQAPRCIRTVSPPVCKMGCERFLYGPSSGGRAIRIQDHGARSPVESGLTERLRPRRFRRSTRLLEYDLIARRVHAQMVRQKLFLVKLYCRHHIQDFGAREASFASVGWS